jgi:hypothetical protein
VSGDETSTVDPGTAGAALDPAALLPRVVQQLLAQILGADGAATPPGDANASPEDQMAHAISGWLTQLLTGGDEEPTLSMLDWDDLLDRNSAVAAALGACDCWGEDPDCAFCGGEGVPGWARPDEECFGTYVRPALAAMSAPTTTAPKGDDHHDAD